MEDPSRAFLYSNGQMTQLGSANLQNHGNSINDSGQVTGFLSAATGGIQAFLYKAEAASALNHPNITPTKCYATDVLCWASFGRLGTSSRTESGQIRWPQP